MPDIQFDENFQPVFCETNDVKVVDGHDELEQWVKLEAQRRLYDVLSQYKRKDIPNKIRLELNRLAQDTDMIDGVQPIKVDRVQGDEKSPAGYRVKIRYGQSDEIETLLPEL